MQTLIIASQLVSFMSSQLRSFSGNPIFSAFTTTKTSKDEVFMSARSLWQHSGEHCVDDSVLTDSNSIQDSSCSAGTYDRAP
jgi:hypothetical protein